MTGQDAAKRGDVEKAMKEQYARALHLADTVWRSETDTVYERRPTR